MEGVRFGDFEVKKKLGEGGMGQVYLARQISLDRNVALKVLPERLARDESFRVRFEREARQAARLNHPNIIQMYAYGIKDGIPYFAMEFVEGTDLAALLRSRGRFPVREALRVTKDVAKALAAAEKRKVVHRDIKPSNIMVKEDGTVKVMDFGLAKAIGSQSMVTQANMVLGTPHYMSPEQGKGAQVDVRSDLYSLGVVLFELLTGEVPFKADTPTSLIYQHIYEQPPPLRGKNPEIPPAVESLVIKMLAKDPDQRFQSPVDVVKVIEQLESGATPSAGGPMTLEIDLPPSEAATLKQERPAVDQRQTDARRVTPVGETTPATPASGQQLTVVVKSRPWVPIVITLIILGAVGGGVYFAYRRGLFRRVSEPPRPTPNGQQKPNGRKPDGQQKPDGQKPPPKPPPPVGHAKVRFPASKLLGRLPSGTVATIRATGTPPVHGIRLDSDIEVEEGRYTVRMERKGYEPVEVSLIVDETGVSPPLTTVRPEWRLRKDLQEALDAAENYRIEKKFELAVRELEKVVKVIPDYDGGKVRQNLERMRTLQEKQVKAEDLLAQALVARGEGKWEKVLSVLEEVTRDYRDVLRDFEKRVVPLESEARGECQKSKKFDVLVEEARRHIREGDLDRAEMSIGRARDLRPEGEGLAELSEKVVVLRRLLADAREALAKHDYEKTLSLVATYVRDAPQCRLGKKIKREAEAARSDERRLRGKIGSASAKIRAAVEANPDAVPKMVDETLALLNLLKERHGRDVAAEVRKLEAAREKALTGSVRRRALALVRRIDEASAKLRLKELLALVDPQSSEEREALRRQFETMLASSLRVVRSSHEVERVEVSADRRRVRVEVVHHYCYVEKDSGASIEGSQRKVFHLLERDGRWYLEKIELR